MKLEPPFPYFGGKRRVASLVWEALGNPRTYCEACAGGAAAFLERPHRWQGEAYEVLNDIDGNITNVWRAIQADPEGVWAHANRPRAEHDLTAWKRELRRGYAARVEALEADPRWYDAEAAGVWLWGQCVAMGKDWASDSKRPTAGTPWGVHSSTLDGASWLRRISARLRGCHILRGDWSRALSMAHSYWKQNKSGPIAAFLDPPYAGQDRAETYTHDSRDIAAELAEWCRENGKTWRIVLAGYEGHYDLPGWQVVRWKAHGGYGVQGDGQARANAHREALWISPACERPQLSLFGG